MGKKYILIPRDKEREYKKDFNARYTEHFRETSEADLIYEPIVSSHRNLSQLGTCFHTPGAGRNMFFGDLYRDCRGYQRSKMVWLSNVVICQELRFPNKLFRFVRS